MKPPPAAMASHALVRRNIAANYAGRLWSIASVYVFVPLYMHILGVQAYGLIAFHSVLLGVLFIADAGLSSAFAREVARNTDVGYLRSLLASLERVYAAVVLVVCSAITLASPWIAGHWFKPSAEMPQSTLTVCICLMGAAVALQVAMSLYNGGLMGAQRHGQANALQVGFSFARSGLVVPLLLVAPDIRLYFAWQLLCAIVTIALMRRAVWTLFGGAGTEAFDARAVRGVARFALGMFGIAVISALNTQMDKLVISKILTLEEFARYAVANLLAQAPSIVTLPIAVSVLPRLTQLAESGDHSGTMKAYDRYAFLIATLSAVIGMIIVQVPEDLIGLWTRNTGVAAGSGPICAILSLGCMFLALQYMPYHLALAHGHNQTNLRLGTIFLMITPVALVLLTQRWGALGAAIPWLAMNACAFVLLSIILTRKFLPGHLRRWMLQANLLPLATCTGVLALSSQLRDMAGDTPFARIAVAVASAAVAAAFCGLLFRRLFGAGKLPALT